MNWFKKWREAKRKEEEARRFDAGFLSACKQVLLDGVHPHTSCLKLWSDADFSWAYEDGMLTAVSELRKIKEKQLPIPPKELPEWMQFVAQDHDGQWWIYPTRPNKAPNSGWSIPDTSEAYAIDKPEKGNPNWEQTLRKLL